MSLRTSMLIAALAYSSFSSACIPPTAKDYNALNSATSLDRIALVHSLTQKYCYDLNHIVLTPIAANHPIFSAATPDILQLYLKATSNISQYTDESFHLDILSKTLVFPFSLYSNITPSQRKEVLSLLQQYDPQAALSWFKNPHQNFDHTPEKSLTQESLSNNRSMVTILLPFYKNVFTLPLDDFGNNAFTYSILTHNYAAASQLARREIFTRRNVEQYSIFHLAFAPHSSNALPNDVQKTNDLLMQYFKNTPVNSLNYIDFKKTPVNALGYINKSSKIYAIPFLTFIGIMKENNPDLYNKIYASLQQKPQAIPPAIYERERLFFNQELNYLHRMQEQE